MIVLTGGFAKSILADMFGERVRQVSGQVKEFFVDNKGKIPRISSREALVTGGLIVGGVGFIDSEIQYPRQTQQATQPSHEAQQLYDDGVIIFEKDTVWVAANSTNDQQISSVSQEEQVRRDGAVKPNMFSIGPLETDIQRLHADYAAFAIGGVAITVGGLFMGPKPKRIRHTHHKHQPATDA